MLWRWEKTQKDAERKKEREKKRKQRLERKKAKEVAAQKLTTPVKRKVKNLEPKLRRKYMKFSEKKSSKKGISSQVAPQNSKLIVSKKIWNHMSQKSKHKVTPASPEIPKGLNRAIFMEIGNNISSPYEISQENEVILFFEHQEVARTCPDIKKTIKYTLKSVIFLQNSNLISCNICISCCDKAKLRSAKAKQYKDKLILQYCMI